MDIPTAAPASPLQSTTPVQAVKSNNKIRKPRQSGDVVSAPQAQTAAPQADTAKIVPQGMMIARSSIGHIG